MEEQKMALSNEGMELTSREQYRLRKLLSGAGASGSGERATSGSSDPEVVFDPEELRLTVKEAVTESLEDFFEKTRGGDSKDSGKPKSGSAEPPRKKVRILI